MGNKWIGTFHHCSSGNSSSYCAPAVNVCLSFGYLSSLLGSVFDFVLRSFFLLFPRWRNVFFLLLRSPHFINKWNNCNRFRAFHLSGFLFEPTCPEAWYQISRSMLTWMQRRSKIFGSFKLNRNERQPAQ